MRFPVTTLLALQYGAFAVYPAIVHHTVLLGLLVRVVGFALFVAFVIELGALLVPFRSLAESSRVTSRAAAIILTIGIIAQLGLSFAGNAGYSAQVTSQANSRVAAVFTPFLSWVLYGAILCLWLYSKQHLSRPRLLVGLGAAAAVEVVAALRAAFLGSLLVFGFSLLVVAVTMGMVRLRAVIALFALAAFVLPTLYDLRNDLRQHAVVTTQVANAPKVSTRIREDRNFAQINNLPSVPVNIGQPDLATMLRVGLLPRVLDPSRATFGTASELSVVLGGQATSSATLTGLGEAYALGGRWRGVGEMVALSTVTMAVAIRRRSAWGYMCVGVLITNALWIESAFPEFLASLLQDGVSLAVAGVLISIAGPGRSRSSRPKSVRGEALRLPADV